MGNYVLAYTGGSLPETDEERQQVTAAWGAWFGQLGESVVDAGNPFGEARTLRAGSVEPTGASGLGGYSIISASDLDGAVSLAKGCPVLIGGGNVEVYEVTPVM